MVKFQINELELQQLKYWGLLYIVMGDPDIGKHMEEANYSDKGCGIEGFVRMLYYATPVIDDISPKTENPFFSWGMERKLISGLIRKSIWIALNRYRLVNFLITDFDENEDNIKGVLRNIRAHEIGLEGSYFGPVYSEDQVEEIFNSTKQLVKANKMNEARDYLVYNMRNYYDLNDGGSMCHLGERVEEDYLWKYVTRRPEKMRIKTPIVNPDTDFYC